MKINELFETIEEFEELLADAERSADNGWEIDFVESIRERYTKYGPDFFLSDKQVTVLNRIVSHEGEINHDD